MDSVNKAPSPWLLEDYEKNQSSSYLVLDNVFTDNEIDDLCNIVSKRETVEQGVTSNPEYQHERHSNVAWLDGDDTIYHSYYRRLVDVITDVNNNYFKFSLTHIEPLQYTEYDSTYKGHYNYHCDDIIGHSLNMSIRKLSFVLALCDKNEYEGGNLTLKVGSDGEDIKPFLSKGNIVFFPSPVLHKVTPVTQGFRRSLVGWVKGPRWI